MINEEWLQLGDGWRVTHISELALGDWQVIATDDAYTCTATGGSIDEAISIAREKVSYGHHDIKAIYRARAPDAPKQDLLSIIGVLRTINATKINRRI